MTQLEGIQSKPCPRCGETITLKARVEDLRRWQNGELIQNVFPTMSADDRERFMTGYCPTCWDILFAEENGGLWAPSTFRIEIELGNETMQTAKDVGEALRQINRDLALGATEGRVKDANGNVVGLWQMS